MKKLKLLIADDDPTAKLLYQKGVAYGDFKDKFETVFAVNGEEAVNKYLSFNPDIVILDIMMPVLSGYEALKKIREIEAHSPESTLIIMATSLSDKDFFEEAIDLGVDGYFSKPIRPKEIAQKILSIYFEKFPD